MADSKKIGLRAEEAFEHLIKIFESKEIDSRVTAKFFLVQYEHGNNREEELAKFLADSITTYATTKEERYGAGKETSQSATLRRYTELVRTALQRFKSGEKSGEIGELVLFNLLERFEGAVQVVNKMSIKTSGEMNFHGADAVHFAFRNSVDILFLGESKIRADFQKAAYDAIESMSSNTAKEEQVEIKLTVGNISSDIPDNLRKKIVEYLDSTVEDKSRFQQTRVALLFFSNNDLKTFETKYKGDELFKKVIEKYKTDIQGYIDYLQKRCGKKDKLKGKEILFYLLPVKDISDIDERFMNLIGKEDGSKEKRV